MRNKDYLENKKMEKISEMFEGTGSSLYKTFHQSVHSYKNWRDELIKEAVVDINSIREGTKFKKETAASLAKRINMNPFLKGSRNDGELALVLKNCRAKRNYSHLYFLLKTK